MSEDFLHFEDLAPGRVFDLGSRTVSAEEILSFAREFDPQPFHTDEGAAAKSIYGGLIASGWHTASLAMRLMVDGILRRSGSQGSPGLEQLRWLKPLRPGDTIYATLEVLEAEPSTRRPTLGRVKTRLVARNQHGDAIMDWTSYGLFSRRPQP